MKLLAVATLALLGLWGCARRTPPPVGPADLAWAQTRWPGVSQQELEHGRKLLQSKCGGSCHRPPLPRDHLASEWPNQVAEMAERSGLTRETQRLLEQYLVTLSRAEEPVRQAPPK